MDKGEKLIKKPVYRGGKEAMSAFIKENMVYPRKALEAGIEGTVAVTLDIANDGKVLRTRIKKSLGHGCDEEAQRLASLLKFYTTNRSKARITFHRTINIHFRLPKKPKPIEQPKVEAAPKTEPVQGFQITYTYVPNKKG
jgi:TonB family protein